ncbi:hypothetical protein HN954_00625 [bacterium]|jgi:hypothetical protein|nr:hypothetical protein [bacterium]MBT6832374.1 hypothetical protein [bacterium]MBT6995919.1 hypothetical protein [bacterium]MBT7772780.1 hypothetical protein [bacterium]
MKKRDSLGIVLKIIVIGLLSLWWLGSNYIDFSIAKNFSEVLGMLPLFLTEGALGFLVVRLSLRWN